jgi:hypothetical protein
MIAAWDESAPGGGAAAVRAIGAMVGPMITLTTTASKNRGDGNGDGL